MSNHLIDNNPHHRRRKPPGAPDMSGQPRGATQTLPGVRVIVNLYRGGSNYGPQAVGTALDFIVRGARRANPRIYNAYVPHITIFLFNCR